MEKAYLHNRRLRRAVPTQFPYSFFISLSLSLSPRRGPSRPGYKTLPVPRPTSHLLLFPTPFALFQPILVCTSHYLALRPPSAPFSHPAVHLRVQTCRFTATLVSSSLFNSSCTVRAPAPFVSFPHARTS